jgi:hypothetical protein
MTVSELVKLLNRQDPRAEVTLYGEEFVETGDSVESLVQAEFGNIYSPTGNCYSVCQVKTVALTVHNTNIPKFMENK